MSWIDLLRMSSSNLRRRKLRTFLTVLGVIIGITSIVVMFSLGLGMQQSLYAEVEQMGGVTNIKVSGKTSEEMNIMHGGFSEEEIESDKFVTDQAIDDFKVMEHIESVYPVLSMPVIILKGRDMAYSDLSGIPGDALQAMNIPLEEGGSLPRIRSGNMELVFGNWIPEMFTNQSTGKGYWDTGEFPDIDYNKDQFFVVLDQESYESSRDSDGGFGELGEDESEAKSVIAPKKYVSQGVGLVAGGSDAYTPHGYNVYCDLDTLTNILKKDFAGKKIPGQPVKKNGDPYNFLIYSYANIQVDDMKNVETISSLFKNMGYNVESNVEYLDSMKNQFAIIQAVLGGIGAISLLVAAIGITNTMMMSIYERTKEIGVLKVLGCSLKNIKQLFLLEAAGIGFLGGLLGNILSLLLSKVTNMIVMSSGMMGEVEQGISFIPWWLICVAMGIGVSVAMIAGYFPARKAMKLSPLEAIRTN